MPQRARVSALTCSQLEISAVEEFIVFDLPKLRMNL